MSRAPFPEGLAYEGAEYAWGGSTLAGRRLQKPAPVGATAVQSPVVSGNCRLSISDHHHVCRR
ncbi:hypothetical protein D9M68_370780 [compost metagenome]